LCEKIDLRETIIICIPAFNEEKHIGTTVKKAKKHAKTVIVVDDGSLDRTSEVAAIEGAEVLRHEQNAGYGASIRSCFDVAKSKQADIMVTLDGDGQHEPDEIASVISPIIKHQADVVIGSRFLGNSQKMPSYRRFGIQIITRLFNILLGIKITDAQSGFRAYGKKAISSINIAETGMEASIESLIHAKKVKCLIVEVPITCRYDENRHSMNAIKHGLSVVMFIIKVRIKQVIRHF
jgi:glycosyltransferase involved in cell wall biosynthesis